MKNKYYLLTVQRQGNLSTNTVWIIGSLTDFLLNELDLGRTTNIIFAHEISEEEYKDGCAAQYKV